MSEEKILSPGTIENTPFPNQLDNTNFGSSQSTGNDISGSKQTQNQGFPISKQAVDLIGPALNTKSLKILAEFQFTESGAIQIGKYVGGVSGDIRISPSGIVGRNKSGVITFAVDADTGDAIFKGTVQAGSLISGGVIIGGSININDVFKVSETGAVTASSMIITGGTISIGSGNNIFKADSNGIYLGNATFASAPFRVTMGGAVTASSVTLTNASIGSGSSYTGNVIAEAYIGNLNASKITAGYISVDRIEALSITAGKIATGTITADQIAGTTITAANIKANTITGAQLSTSLIETTTQYISGGLKVGGAGASVSGLSVDSSAYFDTGGNNQIYQHTGFHDKDIYDIRDGYANNWYNRCEVAEGIDPFEVMASFEAEGAEKDKNKSWKKLNHKKLHKEIYKNVVVNKKTGYTIEAYSLNKLVELQRQAILQLKDRLDNLTSKL